ncbi:hypothetical protein LWI29_025116 [Acer saccharum]|uniref:Transposase MuDR plant domain-containing protein n=1 Tax=Acer saccharum TaxID=4024 RepID=A0AA39S0C3_ACESA|nr:hypothetical protein LWI29_025116 [Acer saccharum]
MYRMSQTLKNIRVCKEREKAYKFVSVNVEIKQGTVLEWKRCNKTLAYDSDVLTVVFDHKQLINGGYRGLVYSGDHDMLIPYTDNFFELYTIVVFYDGVFDKSNGKIEYIGRKCEIVTDCDVIAILDFYDLARRFGYHKDYEAWYVVLGLGLEDGLVKIITNDNVEQMNHALNPDRRVDVYIQGTRVEHDEAGPSNVNQFENVEAKEAEHGEGTNYVEEPEQGDVEDDYLGAYFDSGSESKDFDDDFVEPEYQQEEKPEVVEHNDVYVVDGEEQNEGENDEQENSGFENDESQFDDKQMAALNELRKMDRKRDLKKTKVFNSNFEFFDENSNLRNINLRVGQGFSMGKVFKDVVKDYAIKNGRSILFSCNKPKRVQGVCKMRENGCPWSVWGSRYEKDTTSFLLKTLNDNHTCHRIQKNRLANACWLSKRYTKALKPGGNFNFGDFMGKVRKDYILAPSRSQVYRAKNKAGEIIQGNLYAQYGKLRDYAEELKRSNPGSTVVINTELGANEEHIFKRIYICLNACKVGWLAGCRPIICLDACHNKSQQNFQHKSQLMFAIGIDADNSYYLIAYAVVEKESYDTWKWFLKFLRIDLNLNWS